MFQLLKLVVDKGIGSCAICIIHIQIAVDVKDGVGRVCVGVGPGEVHVVNGYRVGYAHGAENEGKL